jgi:hypothetical protein
MRPVTWRSAAALPLLTIIAYNFWRAGDQVTGGLDPNFTVNAWGGPTYVGAMACHYLDGVLMIAVSAWLLHTVLLPVLDDHDRHALPGRNRSQSPVVTRNVSSSR